jgi:hypothetical protein
MVVEKLKIIKKVNKNKKTQSRNFWSLWHFKVNMSKNMN